MSVLPFRRPKKPAPPEEDLRERCPRCGWLMPSVVRADRGVFEGQTLLYIDCPECGANLILLVESL